MKSLECSVSVTGSCTRIWKKTLLEGYGVAHQIREKAELVGFRKDRNQEQELRRIFQIFKFQGWEGKGIVLVWLAWHWSGGGRGILIDSPRWLCNVGGGYCPRKLDTLLTRWRGRDAGWTKTADVPTLGNIDATVLMVKHPLWV